MKLSKKRYLETFIAVVLLLAVVRWLFPQVAEACSVDTEMHITDGQTLSTLIVFFLFLITLRLSLIPMLCNLRQLANGE